jgi:hypothetical protein
LKEAMLVLCFCISSCDDVREKLLLVDGSRFSIEYRILGYWEKEEIEYKSAGQSKLILSRKWDDLNGYLMRMECNQDSIRFIYPSIVRELDLTYQPKLHLKKIENRMVKIDFQDDVFWKDQIKNSNKGVTYSGEHFLNGESPITNCNNEN